MSQGMNTTECLLGHIKYQLTATLSSTFILHSASVLHGGCYCDGASMGAARPQIGAQSTKI